MQGIKGIILIKAIFRNDDRLVHKSLKALTTPTPYLYSYPFYYSLGISKAKFGKSFVPHEIN